MNDYKEQHGNTGKTVVLHVHISTKLFSANKPNIRILGLTYVKLHFIILQQFLKFIYIKISQIEETITRMMSMQAEIFTVFKSTTILLENKVSSFISHKCCYKTGRVSKPLASLILLLKYHAFFSFAIPTCSSFLFCFQNYYFWLNLCELSVRLCINYKQLINLLLAIYHYFRYGS